jgi:peptidoglycan/xylan/chitin deacetylase (PgdA/CDA1 family)
VTYIVQPGDTLTAIARLFGTTGAAIVEANGLADPDALLVGQVLLIPVTGPLPSPTPAGSAQVVRLGNASRRQVAITFDAAADAGFAAQILDTLKAEEVRASFGITGRWAESNPELLRRMVREGHHLVNHSYDHPSFVEISREERWEQLDRTEEIVQGLARATTKPFFRPPFGAYDASVNADVYARGYLYTLMWTVDSLGWQGLAAEEISRRVLELAQPGAIIVFHVGAASQDANALPTIISGLRDMGYEMGAVPEVLAP